MLGWCTRAVATSAVAFQAAVPGRAPCRLEVRHKCVRGRGDERRVRRRARSQCRGGHPAGREQ